MKAKGNKMAAGLEHKVQTKQRPPVDKTIWAEKYPNTHVDKSLKGQYDRTKRTILQYWVYIADFPKAFCTS